MATHRHVLSLIRKYLDRQRALEFFGALRPEVQTYIENSDSGKKLLGSTADATFTWDEVRGLATEFETREQARDNDVARQLKKLGVDVPKQGKNGKGNAQAKSVGGKGGGKGGKGGKGGRGNRRTRRQGSQRDDETPAGDTGTPVAGLDGTVNPAIQCYGCQRYGHVKKKNKVVNCPCWVVAADGSEYYDAKRQPADGAAPAAPGAVVAQVAPASPATAAPVDIDALMEAFTLSDGPGDETTAAMKQVYLEAASRNAKAQPIMPACILGVLGTAPSGQNFRAMFGINS